MGQQREDFRKSITLGRTHANWMTTTQDHFGSMDTGAATSAAKRFAGAPYFQKPAATDIPEPRGANGWETEYSKQMQDRHHESERDPTYDCKGTFRLVNGVSQMNPIAHRPREVHAGVCRPTDVVPDHFNT